MCIVKAVTIVALAILAVVGTIGMSTTARNFLNSAIVHFKDAFFAADKVTADLGAAERAAKALAVAKVAAAVGAAATAGNGGNIGEGTDAVPGTIAVDAVPDAVPDAITADLGAAAALAVVAPGAAASDTSRASHGRQSTGDIAAVPDAELAAAERGAVAGNEGVTDGALGGIAGVVPEEERVDLDFLRGTLIAEAGNEVIDRALHGIARMVSEGERIDFSDNEEVIDGALGRIWGLLSERERADFLRDMLIAAVAAGRVRATLRADFLRAALIIAARFENEDDPFRGILEQIPEVKRANFLRVAVMVAAGSEEVTPEALGRIIALLPPWKRHVPALEWYTPERELHVPAMELRFPAGTELHVGMSEMSCAAWEITSERRERKRQIICTICVRAVQDGNTELVKNVLSAINVSERSKALALLSTMYRRAAFDNIALWAQVLDAQDPVLVQQKAIQMAVELARTHFGMKYGQFRQVRGVFPSNVITTTIAGERVRRADVPYEGDAEHREAFESARIIAENVALHNLRRALYAKAEEFMEANEQLYNNLLEIAGSIPGPFNRDVDRACCGGGVVVL